MDALAFVIVGAICAAAYYAYSQGMFAQGLSLAQIQAAIDATTKNTTSKIVAALGSGTGDPAIAAIFYPGVFTQLTPGSTSGYGGYDDLGRAPDPQQPKNPDGSTNWVYQEDWCFFNDVNTQTGMTVTDLDGAKQLVLARQPANQPRKIYIQSFKVQPGSMLMITAHIAGAAPAYGFLLRGIDCRDVADLLTYYPEVSRGNNGIYWEGWPYWDITWTITVLNKAAAHHYMLRKFNTCLDTAMGIGNSQGDQSDPNLQLGLHYGDGAQVLDSAGKKTYGRWIYDKDCQPVMDPATGKQAYHIGSSGWGQSCQQAHEFCALDPALMVGIKLDQFDITPQGMPEFVGVEDVPGGTVGGPLAAYVDQPGKVGWVPTAAPAAPADAAAQLTSPAVTAPASTASRFADRSSPFEKGYGTSRDAWSHHVGSEAGASDALAGRYLSETSM